MLIADLEKELEEARTRLRIAAMALRGKHQGDALADYRTASERLLWAERALAVARGEEHATPCSGLPAWDTGAPLPHLLRGHCGTILVYRVRTPDPKWDGRTARIVDVASEDSASVAVVRFVRLVSARIGAPNDEALGGHPLYGKGLAAYEAHLVVNSRWIEALRKVNSVHACDEPKRWIQCNHYILAFHDETLECVADGFTVETLRTTLAKACRDALEEVMGVD